MSSGPEMETVRQRAAELLSRANLVVRPDEIMNMEVVDFGLGEIDINGVQIVTLLDTNSVAVKLLILMPNQVEPEHKHPRLGDYPGKEETIRCAWGELYLYGPGAPSPEPRGRPPGHRKGTYTVWHEYLLKPGDQVTFQPNALHWFQGGPEGAVIWSFSSRAIDVEDIFTDPEICR